MTRIVLYVCIYYSVCSVSPRDKKNTHELITSTRKAAIWVKADAVDNIGINTNPSVFFVGSILRATFIYVTTFHVEVKGVLKVV